MITAKQAAELTAKPIELTEYTSPNDVQSILDDIALDIKSKAKQGAEYLVIVYFKPECGLVRLDKVGSETKNIILKHLNEFGYKVDVRDNSFTINW